MACSSLLLRKWYTDDGVLAGPKLAVAQALPLYRNWVPHYTLSLRINNAKCELYSLCDLSLFPSDMKRSLSLHFEILGAPIGDVLFCGKFIAQKRAKALHLLKQLEEVGSVNPQVALLFLRLCCSSCRLVHLARSTPPSMIGEGLALFDNDVRHCFAECTLVDTSDTAWQQPQLFTPWRPRALSLCPSFICCMLVLLASVIASDCSSPQSKFLSHSMDFFNGSVSTIDAPTITTVLTSKQTQNVLSTKLEDQPYLLMLHCLIGLACFQFFCL